MQKLEKSGTTNFKNSYDYGMNYFMSKPIVFSELKKVLQFFKVLELS